MLRARTLGLWQEHSLLVADEQFKRGSPVFEYIEDYYVKNPHNYARHKIMEIDILTPEEKAHIIAHIEARLRERAERELRERIIAQVERERELELERAREREIPKPAPAVRPKISYVRIGKLKIRRDLIPNINWRRITVRHSYRLLVYGKGFRSRIAGKWSPKLARRLRLRLVRPLPAKRRRRP